MKKNFYYIINTDRDKYSGVGRYTYNVGEGIRNNVNFLYISYYKILKYQIKYIGTFFYSYKKIINKKDIIIHNPAPEDLIYLNKKNISLITIHDIIPLDYNVHDIYYRPSIENILGYKLQQFILNYDIKNYSYIVANSKIVKERLINKFPEINPKNIIVISNGIDSKFKIKTKKTNKFIVCYMGGFLKRKNVNMSINAYSLFFDEMLTEKERDSIEFRIYGTNLETAYRNGLDKNENYLKTHNIYFMGRFEEENIVDIYNDCNVLLFLSTSEGFGYPIMEAKACGVPVINLENAQISEEITKYSILVKNEYDAAKNLEDIFKNGYDSKLKKEMSEYAKSFSIEKQNNEIINLYEKIYTENM